MKVVLKTVSGKQHEADVEATTTVLALKHTLANEYDVTSVRLVHKGSILDDAKTMAEVGVAEHDSIVIAGKKRSVAKLSSPKQTATTAAATAATTETTTTATTTTSHASPASTSAPSAPATTTTATTTSAPTTATAATSTPATATTTSPATTATPTTTTTQAATAPATTPVTTTTPPAATTAASSTAGVDASLIDSIVAMGFDDRAQVALALRAAYMNADRAVEYLFAGIPAARLRELNEAAAMRAAAEAASHAPHTTTTTATPAGAGGGAGEGSSGGGDGGSGAAAAATAADRDALQQLRSALHSIPQFEHVREVFRQNAASMPAILQQIAQRYPAIYALVQQYPDHFLSIMHETTEQGGAAAATAAGRVGAGGAGRAGPVQPSELLSHMSDAELADVQELVTLGGGLWDAPAAALVYVATRADKEMAASVLFEHGGVPPALVEALQHGGLRMRTGNDTSGDDDEDDGGEGDEDADN